MNINDLNDDCLVKLLNLFSSRELIILRAVCRRWEYIVLMVGKSRKSLKLFGLIDDLELYVKYLQFYQLQDDPYYKLSQSSAHDEVIRSDFSFSDRMSLAFEEAARQQKWHFLADIFPNISKLIVFDTFPNDDLVFLLKHWPKIESLSIFQCSTSRNSLFDAINSLTSLTRLELYSYFDLPICQLSNERLAQLEHLSLDILHNEFEIADYDNLIHQLNPTIFKKLFLWQGHDASGMFDRILSLALNSDLLMGITHLSLGPTNCTEFFDDLILESNFGITLETLKLLCGNFPSLTYLSIVPREIDLACVLEPLKQLKVLKELTVSYIKSQLLFTFTCIAMSSSPLESIKVLNLNFSRFLITNPVGFGTLMAEALPNLEQLHITEQCNNSELNKMQKSLKIPSCKTIREICHLNQLVEENQVVPFLGQHVDRYQRYQEKRKLENLFPIFFPSMMISYDDDDEE